MTRHGSRLRALRSVPGVVVLRKGAKQSRGLDNASRGYFYLRLVEQIVKLVDGGGFRCDVAAPHVDEASVPHSLLLQDVHLGFEGLLLPLEGVYARLQVVDLRLELLYLGRRDG